MIEGRAKAKITFVFGVGMLGAIIFRGGSASTDSTGDCWTNRIIILFHLGAPVLI